MINEIAKYVDTTTIWNENHTPRHHQLQAISFYLYQFYEKGIRTFILPSVVGSGKTFISLSLMRALGLKKCLYVTGSTAGVSEAAKEVKKHFPEYTIQLLDNENDSFTESDISIIAYGSLVASKYCVDRNKKLVPSNKKILNFIENITYKPEFLILDEAHKINKLSGKNSNIESLRFHIIKRIATHIPFTIMATGTPVGTYNTLVRETDYYPILHLIDPKKYPNFKSFLNQFGFLVDRTPYGCKYEITNTSLTDTIKELTPVMDVKRDAEVVVSHSVVRYELTQEQISLNPLNLHISKRRQCYSGHLLDRYGNVSFIATEKTSIAVDLVKYLVSIHTKLIIVFEFIATYTVIKSNLERNNIPFVSMTSKMSIADKTSVIELFSKNVDILVLSIGVGGESQNLQFCSNMLFWDTPTNTTSFMQCKGRIDRPIGSVNKVTFHYLVNKYEVNKLKKLFLSEKNLNKSVYNSDKETVIEIVPREF